MLFPFCQDKSLLRKVHSTRNYTNYYLMKYIAARASLAAPNLEPSVLINNILPYLPKTI